MRLLIVQMTGNYPLDIGGPATVAYYLAYHLAKKGIEASMLIRLKERNELEKLRETHEFNILEKNVEIIPVHMRYDLKSMLNVPGVLYKIYKTTRNFKPENYDIIHYNSPPVDVTLFFPPKSKNKTKQTIAIHGGLLYESKNFIGRFLLRKYANLFHKVIALNNFSRKLALNAGFEESKIIQIPNGVDVDYFDSLETFPLEGDPSIIYAGRLAKIKGVDVLLNAFYYVLKKLPNAHLYIIGDGKEKKNLTKLAEKLVLKNVKFEGFIPSTKKVHQYIKSSDIFVLPSYRENFSISLLEAMAAKTPIIASNAEGNMEVLSSDKALFFNRGDSKELAEKIIQLANDKNFRTKLAEKAYSLAASRYSWSVVAAQYISVFNEVVNKC